MKCFLELEPDVAGGLVTLDISSTTLFLFSLVCIEEEVATEIFIVLGSTAAGAILGEKSTVVLEFLVSSDSSLFSVVCSWSVEGILLCVSTNFGCLITKD